jgi:protein-S-isoprenylcysteine O-methyltransferase Ste14
MALLEEFESQGNFLFRYRTHLPLVVLVLGLLVFYYQNTQGSYNNMGETYWYLSMAVGLMGLALRVYTVGHTPANTSGRNTAQGQLADQLNSTGIYSLVRHPLYLGNFLMWLAVAMLTTNVAYIIGFVLAYWIYYERIMYAEEAFLRSKFGTTYTNWANSGVPAFVPRLSGFVSPQYPFSLKKVLKKEKNGLAALFILFYLFQIVGNFATTGQIQFQPSAWFWGTLATGVLYGILKLIKYKTNMLNEDGR